jgi:LPXTG-site transpeptidase (sortase) family protein
MTDQVPRRGRRGSRRGAIFVAAIAVVAIVAGLMITACAGPDTASPTPAAGDAQATSPAFTDLPLVAVTPAATPTLTITVAPPSPSGSASPSAGADAGIRANRIRIARLGIDLKIIEGDGIDAPIGKVAHYPGSAWPGAGSNVYIYGHAREGMFLTLWKARVGDTIELDLVDGTTRAYVVDQVLPKVPWDAMKYVRPTKTEQLTLQTSTSYHPTSPRFIVIAHPAP